MITFYRIFFILLFILSSVASYAQHNNEEIQDVFFDITTYEPMRNRAIDAVHAKELLKAKIVLDSCYAINNLDTMVIALLHETLLMHINKQKNPSKNLKDIAFWESQYSFLKKDERIQKIKIQDAVYLSMQAFNAKKLARAEELARLIAKTIKESTFAQQFKQIANVDAIFYNIGMHLFYDKKFSESHDIFTIGKAFYPLDNNMDTMFKLSKERLTRKK